MIIGLCGRAGSGKDTLAKVVCESKSIVEVTFGAISFAQPMKKFCEEVFDFSYEQLYGPSERRNAGDERYVRPDGTLLSPREALQTLGTEWGRACYPNVWVDLGIRRAQKWPADHVFITDCRFANEVDAVRRAGGKIIRIKRTGPAMERSGHVSEREMESIPESSFDAVIYNESTLEDFEKRGMDVVLELVNGSRSGAW